MSKHTPAPWSILPEEVDKDYIRIRGTKPGGMYKIANVVTPVHLGAIDSYANESRANARLIAAAPELLEALEESFDFPADFFECEEADVVTITVTGRHLRMVGAAIAKARGET